MMRSKSATARNKGVYVKLQFSNGAILSAEIKADYATTTASFADVFTKPLGPNMFHRLPKRMLKLKIEVSGET